ncbi:unnamed protein product [Thlaspi arvense]|uniref:Sulfotransferase n=1 Tax=Thlaspi arvense TaxID=13288 RepID=A0AAU9SV01_THLAR|nr:unnamed protein product [Thlaspi arvense]
MGNQGYWIPSKHLKAQDSHIILSTFPKSGTTWIKTRCHSPSPCNPHNLVPFFDIQIYGDGNENPNLENLPNPHTFATHLLFSLLPPSITYSNSRIMYICQNPSNELISCWYFFTNLCPKHNESNSIEELVKMFQEGTCGYGPFWDHVLEYWNKSLEKKDMILLLNYEDLKEDIISQSIKLSDFLGSPFSEKERKRGVIEDISRLCSFRNLIELEVNKIEDPVQGIPNNFLLGKGRWEMGLII